MVARKNPMIPLAMAPRESMDIGCGDCKACCTVFTISELEKSRDVDCEFLLKNPKGRGCGCGIYNDRPPKCKNFYCAWVQNMVMHGKQAYRPDKLGLIVTVMAVPPLEGVIGMFRYGKGTLSARAKGFMREMERTSMYFFEGKMYGTPDRLAEWKRKFVEKGGQICEADMEMRNR